MKLVFPLVAELAQIVLGTNPRRHTLLDPGNAMGYWMRTTTDTVRALDEQ